MYKRIGLLVPSTNTTVEADFQRIAPVNVSGHSQRLFVPPGEMTEATLDQMNVELEACVASVASACVDVIAYACTSGTFFKGRGWDDEVVATAQRISGVPAVTTSNAVVEALRHFKAGRVSVATPYPEWTNVSLRAYLEAIGFEVLNVERDPEAAPNGPRSTNDQDPSAIFEFASRIFDPRADVLFCSCTAWRSLEAAHRLEEAIGKPVVTSNQALIWSALRSAGVRCGIERSGALLERID